jgi:hypothetical protein
MTILSYKTQDGEEVRVEGADFILVTEAGPDDHVFISRSVAVANACDLKTHSCRIEAQGCFVTSPGNGPPNAGEL